MRFAAIIFVIALHSAAAQDHVVLELVKLSCCVVNELGNR